MKKSVLLAAGLMFGLSIGITSCIAVEAAPVTTKELVESYLLADNAPVLMDTTAYCHGSVCCRGEKPREGIVAAAPQWYGMACVIYEAIPTEGGYEVGELLGTWEILDTGYGKSIGDGVRSSVLPGKASRGTIETGKHVDVYKPTMAAAKEWMELTGGKCFVQILSVKG